MDELLASILTPEQQAMAQQRAQQNLLLNLGFGLLGASQGQPGQPRPGLGQIVSQVGPQVMQAYQGSFDQTLKNILTTQQLQEAQRKRADSEKRQKLISDLAQDPRFADNPAMQAYLRISPEEALKSIAVPKDFRMLTTSEAATLGLPTDRTYQVGPDNKISEVSKGPLVQILGDKSRENLFKEIDIPIVSAFTTSATSSREFAQTSEQINNLLKNKGGGELVKIGTDLAKNLGFKNDTVSAQDLANSLVVQLAPRMRAPGSGSTSDIEFKSYIAAVPSLATSEPGRGMMAKYARAFATRNAKLADYAKSLARQDKLSFEAIDAYDRSLGPVLGEDFYSSVKSTQAPASQRRDFRGQ